MMRKLIIQNSVAMGLVPQTIPVPTPPVSATQAAPALASQMPESSSLITVQVNNREEIIAMTLVCIMLLSFVWLHRVPGLRSLTKENPC
jgi:hypothetical protein